MDSRTYGTEQTPGKQAPIMKRKYERPYDSASTIAPLRQRLYNSAPTIAPLRLRRYDSTALWDVLMVKMFALLDNDKAVIFAEVKYLWDGFN